MNIVKSIVILAIFLSLSSCARAENREGKSPIEGIKALHGRGESLRGFLDAGGERTLETDLEITPENWRSAGKIGIRAWLINSSNIALCIPSVMLQRSGWSNEVEVFEMKTGQSIKTLYYHQNRDWPDQNYRVLPPESAGLFTRDVVDSSMLKPGKVYTIKMQLPAFDCAIFARGYPATQLFIDGFLETQSADYVPLVTVGDGDVYIFEGVSEEFGP